jgi:hypothetical protein
LILVQVESVAWIINSNMAQASVKPESSAKLKRLDPTHIIIFLLMADRPGCVAKINGNKHSYSFKYLLQDFHIRG